jgi:hypothetical protein
MREEIQAEGENLVPDVASALAELITLVAEAIDVPLHGRATIKAAGGPYETSNLLGYEKRLAEAAAAAIATIVEYAPLQSRGTN